MRKSSGRKSLGKCLSKAGALNSDSVGSGGVSEGSLGGISRAYPRRAQGVAEVSEKM